jgi:hypothetical protein
VPAVVRAGRIPWLTLARAALLFGPFACSLLAVNAVTRGGRVVGHVAGFIQRLDEIARRFPIVFDKQDFHGRRPRNDNA